VCRACIAQEINKKFYFESHLNLGIYRIILKCIFAKYGWRMWTEFTWLRTETGGRFL
jgi:hypothetical protein